MHGNVIPDILKEFRKKYPDIKIDIKVEQSTVLEERLENDEVDIVIDNTITHDSRYEYIPLMKEQILVGVPRDFQINESLKDFEISRDTILRNCDYSTLPKIDISLLKDEEFILLKHGNKMNQIAGKIFEEAGISPIVSLEFDLLMTSVNYADSGFGSVFLTDTIIKHINDFKNLALYLPDTEHKDRTLYIIYKKSKYLTTAASELINFMQTKISIP